MPRPYANTSTNAKAFSGKVAGDPDEFREIEKMGALALTLFVLLFGFGQDFIGGMEGANMQLALFASFLFGIICGWTTNR
ncbi:hypothetical protein ACSMXM_12855 [Pacificimonas sp. ICDLI1SI03]